MYAVKEERIIVDGVQCTRSTAVIATEEEIMTLEVSSLEAQQPQQPAGIPWGTPPIAIDAPPLQENKGCCGYGCCECDDDYPWYNVKGKGCCVILLLILMYIVLFPLFLPFAICIFAFFCIACLLGKTGEDD